MPSELALDFSRIDRVAPVAAGGEFGQGLTLEKELEPRMDADQHGFSRSYSHRQTHPKEVASDMRNPISVHRCPSAVLFSSLG
jgi:hypothetical protein